MKKGIGALLLVWVLFCCAGVRVSAAEVPDLSRKGSIRIAMEHEGEKIPGGTMTIHHTGEIREDGGNYSFVPTEDFLNSGIVFADSYSEKEAIQLADFAVQAGLTGSTGTIDDNGEIRFDELEPGLYLFVQNKAAAGFEKVSPFLVSLPQLENGRYIYEVDASPKVGEMRETETTVPPDTKPSDPTLPQTGQLNWPVAVMASAGLMLLTLGFALRREKY